MYVCNYTGMQAWLSFPIGAIDFASYIVMPNCALFMKYYVLYVVYIQYVYIFIFQIIILCVYIYKFLYISLSLSLSLSLSDIILHTVYIYLSIYFSLSLLSLLKFESKLYFVFVYRLWVSIPAWAMCVA